MYILTECLAFLVVAIILGVVSFAVGATYVLLAEGYSAASRFARGKGNRTAAIMNEPETESALA